MRRLSITKKTPAEPPVEAAEAAEERARPPLSRLAAEWAVEGPEKRSS